MPSSLLFAINEEGRVFGLSTNGSKWREFIYLGLEFKQLSAVPNFLWGLGSDRQIYVHVHGLDIPIRVKEEAFENERWTPFDGFSKKLLPTDRYNFSNHDGTINRDLKNIRLPSMAWQWEGDWRLELILDGQPLDHDGWTYAIDFPGTYYPTKQWTSCVRRRKWVRYRKYIALNSWCAIAPLHKDPTKEPFICVAIGGTQLLGGEEGSVTVWAVTAYGRVMFRSNVSFTSPEGLRWISISVPDHCEVSQISVGCSGLVWVVLRNGKAMVRTGITRDCITGSNWVEVDEPEKNSILSQVSIGYNGLWAISQDFRVWFRKGIDGQSFGFYENSAKGIRWIHMCGNMINISVASNDQVWAIGAKDRTLYFRTSVTQHDLMGKTWRAVGAPTQLSRTNSSSTLKSTCDGLPKEKRHRSWASLNSHGDELEDCCALDLDMNKTCHSAPAITRSAWEKYVETNSLKSCSCKSHKETSEFNKCNLETNVKPSYSEKINEIKECSEITYSTCNSRRPLYGNFNKDVAVPTRSYSPEIAGGTVIATEAHNAVDSIVFEPGEIGGIYSEHGEREEEDDHLYWFDIDAVWSSVEAGACLINLNHLPNWFIDYSNIKEIQSIKIWREKILKDLQIRIPRNSNFRSYENAIDTSTWIKTGNCKCLLPNESNFKDCAIELEWINGEKNNLNYCTLMLFSLNKIELLAQINLKNVSAVIGCSVPRRPRLALYINSSTPVKFQFGTEEEYEEWKSELSVLCCKIRNICDSPSSHAIWITTTLGEIFMSDPSFLNGFISNNENSLELTFSTNNMPIEIPLPAGFLPGASITLWGCIHDRAEKFAINFLCCEENGNSNIAFHFNPRFEEAVVVQNSRKGLIWGPEERSRCVPFKRGAFFELQISCTNNFFTVAVDGKHFTEFSTCRNKDDEKLTPPHITHLFCEGDLNVSKILYSSTDIIIEPRSMFWSPIDGHLKKIESAGGITWGIGFNNTVWLYCGSKSSKHKMQDFHYFYVYENQRWNPLTGYTSHGLPTDRFMWSDVTGKYKRTKENTLLLSKTWQWTNEWSIDFHLPGGVDKEGWQYAMDFPYSYHASKTLTDYVRRRRWVRCAKIETEGPWLELGYTPLLDCSLYSNGNEINVWAVAVNGYVLFRRGVSKSCPGGLSWEHISSDEQMISISSGLHQVWAVGKSGAAFCRIGVTSSNPLGNYWETVLAPTGASLKQISIGEKGIWVLDNCGRISTRSEVTEAFPLGRNWMTLPSLSDEHNLKDECGLPSTFVRSGGFRQVKSTNKLWAITSSGRLVYRLGVNSENPLGSLWLFGIESNVQHISG